MLISALSKAISSCSYLDRVAVGADGNGSAFSCGAGAHPE